MGKYHFIAIGGIGMSGLAKYLLEDGHLVSGSDISDSKYVEKLRNLGAKIYIGHNADNVPSDAIIVVSTAIKENNPELIRAKELGLKIYHRSDMLKEIAETAQKKGAKFIGFSGTHGKTTTSGFASYLLDKASYEPSFVDGGIIPEISTNAQHKSDDYFIAELDESDGTIVKYSPDILVINNLEEDHLDFYKNGMPDLLKTFEQAVSNSKKVIINNDNAGTKLLNGSFVTFGLSNADYVAKNINYSQNFTTFDIYHNDKLLLNAKIVLFGKHNIYNALAVISALNEAGIDVSKLSPFLKDFTGMGRRFQKVYESDKIKVYDDYAHHPTEISAALDSAFSKFGKENVVVVFQPHRFTRLKGLWNEFLKALTEPARVIVTDVYAASEEQIEGITSAKFASELSAAEYISGSIQDVAIKLLPTLKSGNVVLGLGAGTITDLGKCLQEAEKFLSVR